MLIGRHSIERGREEVAVCKRGNAAFPADRDRITKQTVQELGRSPRRDSWKPSHLGTQAIPWVREVTPGLLTVVIAKLSATEGLDRILNRLKSRVRSRVEHVFAVVKRLWGFDKARYRGLAKNATRAFVATGLANIYLARERLGA
jgi:hypothetical protein